MSRHRKPIDSRSPVEQVQAELIRKKRILRRRRRRIFFRRVLVFSVLFLFVGGVVYVDQQPFSRVQSVTVSGNHFINSDIILEQSNVSIGNRLLQTYAFLIDKNVGKIPGVAISNTNVYYTKGQVSLNVKEKKVVAYLEESTSVLFEDNAIYPTNASDYTSYPMLKGFTKELLEAHKPFADKLSRIDSSAFNNIAEIHVVQNEYESLYLELIMNNGFKVYTSLENLMLMNHYVEITSSILEGDRPSNRCIYFLDYYDDMPDSQVSVARPCEN